MNAIVLMAIGENYARSLAAVRGSFLKYAEHCNADLVVCDTPPDPSFKRNILCQKMLLPDLYKQYEWLAYFDLDILISRHAPSIFDYTDCEKAFSAVTDQRSSRKFANVVNLLWKQPRILTESHESYFSDRGFPAHPFTKASINGGVWLCKPERIAKAFEDFYFSDFGPMIHEEAMMAFAAQKADLFFALDEKFNTQLIYELFASEHSSVLKEIDSRAFKRLKKRGVYGNPLSSAYPPAYKALIDQALENCYFLHFSGGFPYINLNSVQSVRAENWPDDLIPSANNPSADSQTTPRFSEKFGLISERWRKRLRI